MISKTPNFDKAIEGYFSGLELDDKGGQERICRFSREKFYVRPEDVAFYKKLMVPLPTLSPIERTRRRMAYFDTYHLFRVKSAYSGKEIIASYPPNTPYKIYEHQVWFSDKWEPFEFGMDYDSQKSFFEQFSKLQYSVPRPNLVVDNTNVDSEYTNNTSHLKNCYLAFDTRNGENLFYFDCCEKNSNCVDCQGLTNCDNCYGCQTLYDSYRCFFCEESGSCIDSFFLFDCKDCDHCFMCSNLRHKKYYFLNQPFPKEEYEKKLSGINLGNYKILNDYLNQFQNLKIQAVYKPDHNTEAINSKGDYIIHSKNCYWGYAVYFCENVNYSLGLANYRDSYDVFAGAGGELCYEFSSLTTEKNFNVRLSSRVNNCRDVEYCDLCFNCRNCFGCIGLSNKSFCVLNKQYSEKEYCELIDKIKNNMMEQKEYGEFFPPKLMTSPYRVSYAASYPGFRDYETAGKYGYDLSEVPSGQDKEIKNAISSSVLPLDIKDVDKNIFDKTIFDEKNKKYFKITPFELAFYGRNQLALPREHPLARLAHFRETYDNIRLVFYERKCKNCGIEISSVFEPEKYENVYCEKCYNKSIT